MQSRELVLRILRLNLIPAPRVVTPGPATVFPVLYMYSEGSEKVVNTLDEAKALSKAVAGYPRDESAADFFCEILPVEHTAQVAVSDLRGEWRHARCDTAEEERREAIFLAVRATYVLGLDRATVTVGFGPCGPWVINVEPQGTEGNWGLDEVSRQRSPIRFLHAKAEYIAVEPRSGRCLNRFFVLHLTPEGEMIPSGAGAGDLDDGGSAPPETYTWISSPLPRPEMPLCTRFVFQGEPTTVFLRALDRSVAVLGMMFSRPGEARERNGLGEGLLGSYRYTGEGVFEYTTVPGLLRSPGAMKRLCEAVSAVVERYNAAVVEGTGDEGAGEAGGQSTDKPGRWTSHLEGLYRWQRAYYHADKAFFRDLYGHHWLSDNRGFSGIGPDELEDLTEGDFRPGWGLEAPEFHEPCVTVASGASSTGFKALTTQSDHVVLGAGARQVSVKSENVLAPDVLDSDDFERGSPAWAAMTLVRPNPAAARMLALPDDAVLRAHVANVASGGECLRIGPVIGIMAPELTKGQRFGVETDRFRHMIRLGAELGLLVYVFFPEDLGREGPHLDPSAGVLRGWTHRDRRGWLEEFLPVPDVVYDRYIPASRSSARDVAREFSEAFPQAVFVNSLPLVRLCRDKLRSHEALARHPEIARHLPCTEPVSGPEDAVRFASSRQRSFLKLRFGTGTKGLALIENLGSAYRITRREKGTPPRVDEVKGQDGLLGLLSDILQVAGTGEQGKQGQGPEYIIQEGIDLAPLPGGKGGAFEVRVVYQKGGAGVWLRTGMVVRANPEAERFVVPGVELHHRVGHILELALPGRADEVKAEVRRVARMIPPALEEHSDRGGEISVDLGIDRKGKPWLIEVNSKPATLFRDIGAFGLRRLSLLRVLNYAITLHEELHSS